MPTVLVDGGVRGGAGCGKVFCKLLFDGVFCANAAGPAPAAASAAISKVGRNRIVIIYGLLPMALRKVVQNIAARVVVGVFDASVVAPGCVTGAIDLPLPLLARAMPSGAASGAATGAMGATTGATTGASGAVTGGNRGDDRCNGGSDRGDSGSHRRHRRHTGVAAGAMAVATGAVTGATAAATGVVTGATAAATGATAAPTALPRWMPLARPLQQPALRRRLRAWSPPQRGRQRER